MKNDKFIIITGGFGFVGSFFCEKLIKNNYKVIVIDKNKPENEYQKNIARKCYMWRKIDITKEKQILRLFQEIKRKKIEINFLINNAAIDSVPKKNSKKNHLPKTKIWNDEIAVSLTGSYLMIKYFGEQMANRNFGKIVNIGSDLSIIAPNQKLYSDFDNFLKPVTYSVIKHGLLGLTRYFASLYAAKKVTVNMLSPGPIYNNQNNKFVKKLKDIIPMNRMANREDIIETLLFLLNKNNSYLTGQNILVDGGRTLI